MDYRDDLPKAATSKSRQDPLDADALQNLTGFFALLYEIDTQNKAQSSKD